ncbi:MAG TPA: nuclear transport factor 2 family protein [Candidatus Acidoferrum sp.]|nr:nuclear transport factor 2 family protein [Candidatus Acidoferrum sp.]
MRMKRQTQLVAIIAGLALVAAVASSVAAHSDRKATADAELQIREVLGAQLTAWNRGDIPGYMNGYWNSDDLTFVGAGGVLHGWKPALQRYKQLFRNPGAMGLLSFTSLEVHVECQEAAYVIGEYRLRRVNGVTEGAFTLQFRKFPEGWLIVVDHTTGYPPKPQAGTNR